MKNLMMVLFLVPAFAAAEPYRGLAKDLSKAARAAGLERVAVLPLSSVAGAEDLEGRLQAERLTTQIAKLGKIQVVERAQMNRVMGEHFLGQTGALDPNRLAKLGRLLQAQAVLTGTFASVGGSVELNVRLVNVETGVVVTAAQARLERQVPVRELFAAPAYLSAEQAVADVLADQRGEEIVVEVPVEEAVVDVSDCGNAAEKVDRLEASILELKARHWAKQAAEPGFDAGRHRPASIISSPKLRRTFFDLMKKYASRPAPAMTMSEVQRFIEVDGRAFALHSRCGV